MSNNEQYYKIYNILKKLGFKSSLFGTKLLIKAILIANKYNDYYKVDKIYSIISKEYKNLSPIEVKNYIAYSLNSRNKDTSKQNFESVFGYEYDPYVFTNKELIVEIDRVINNKVILL